MRLKRAAILLFLALWPSPAPAKCELESVGRALATRHLVPAALSAESVRKVLDGLVIQGKNQQFLVSSKVIDSPNPWLAKTDVKRITFEVRTTTGDLAGDGHVEVLNGRFGDIGIDVNGFQRQGIGKAIFQKLFDVAPRGMVLSADSINRPTNIRLNQLRLEIEGNPVYLKLLGPDERADRPREGSMAYSFLASSLTQAARRATEGPVLWYKLMQDVGWQDLRVVPRYHQEPGEGIDVQYTISGVKP